MNNTHQNRIFFSAAETSADKHTAKLIAELQSEFPDWEFDGLGGDAMEAAGCNLLENLVDRSAMLAHALGQVSFYRKLLAGVKRYFIHERPDLVVVVDSPAWNFHVAKAARKLGIPVLYYIAPQLWAWGAWRTAKLKRCADRVACILPFEQQWFRTRGVNADYVGHPLFDGEVAPVQPVEWQPNTDKRDYPVIALLPGSRRHELDRLWQPMQKIAHKVRGKYPLARFVTVAANDDYETLLKETADSQLNIEVRRTSIEAACRYADLAVVASGTATLEVAAQHCPMVVMYYVSRWQWYLVGRWLIKSPYICLVNILANRELVPEFIPFHGNVKPVANKVLELVEDKDKLKQIRDELGEMMMPIVRPGAAKNVIDIIKTMLPEY